MNQLDTNQTDLVGFPPDLTAPLRPAIPRHTGQVPLGMMEGDPRLPGIADPASGAGASASRTTARGFEAALRTPSCVTASSPLSSASGLPMIDVDDDLGDLEVEDLEDDELGDLDDDDDDDDDDAGGDDDTGAGEHAASRRGVMFGPGLYGPAPEPALEHGAQPAIALGAATFGERARRIGARFAQKVLVPVAAIALLVIAMGGTWSTAGATPTTFAATQPTARTGSAAAHADGTPDHAAHASKSGHRELTGKLNLNTATEDQLMVLPSVGPAKAERIVTWRKKNGGFKRTADLRRVKGFGYKTFKKLEPYLDIKGDTTLAAK